MLSVRHIAKTGHEDIYLAHRVSYHPPVDTAGPSAAAGHEVFIDFGDAQPSEIINDGTVFVMNDKGATIARYDFAMPPIANV